MELRVRHVLRHMRRASRMAHEDDALGVAATARNVLAHPLQGRLDVLLRRRPRVGRGQAVGHVDADHALAHGPQHDVVVKRTVSCTARAAHKAPAVHKHQYGLARLRFVGGEHVQQVSIICAVAHIAAHLHARIGLALGQRSIEFFSGRRRDDWTNFEQFSGHRGCNDRRHLDDF